MMKMMTMDWNLPREATTLAVNRKKIFYRILLLIKFLCYNKSLE